MEFGSTAFWLALGQIIWVNILLSGDNAVVIALAARSLPPKQQKQAILIGSGAAIAMRIVLTLVAAQLLQLPWLKLIAAVRTILIADLVMSLDNVIAVAAAAKGDTTLLIIGLAMSIPLVIFGSTLLLKVIERFPIVVWLGAGLLGFIAGEIVVDDPAVKDTLLAMAVNAGLPAAKVPITFGLAGIVLVLLIGWAMLSRKKAASGKHARAH